MRLDDWLQGSIRGHIHIKSLDITSKVTGGMAAISGRQNGHFQRQFHTSSDSSCNIHFNDFLYLLRGRHSSFVKQPLP